MAAAFVGLLGSDGGIVWIVAGVWTVRSMAGTPLGYAWGLVCVGAGFRWGTLGLGDLEVATRLVAPTLFSGSAVVRGGMTVSVVGALLAEAQVGGFSARTWGERAAAAIAVSVLPPLFVAAGPGDVVWQAAVSWALPAAVATAAVLLLQPLATRLPGAIPVALSVGGVSVALLGS